MIRTSVPASNLTGPQVVATYKSLTTVDRAFRSMKSVDLKVRPIHHHQAERVKAHVFLCMLAYLRGVAYAPGAGAARIR